MIELVGGSSLDGVITHVINSSNGPGGNISPLGDVYVPENTAITYTITADPGYSISNVIVDGTAIGAVPSYTFSDVKGEHIISAWFSENHYTITATTGPHGSISPSGSVSVNYGASKTFTITPNTGYQVSDVLVDGVSVGAVSSYTFSNVQADHTISATFSVVQYAITTSAGPGGSISPSGSVPVNYGSNQTFTISANAGYHVSGVLVDGVSVGAVSTFTFSSVQADHTISATFSVID